MKNESKQILVNMKDCPELYDALNAYRISLGWTWKRFILRYMAETVAQEGTNPDLALAIVDYLGSKR